MSPRSLSASALSLQPAPWNPPRAFPSAQEIERVLAVEDPVLRNLLVTQRYHELASAVAGWLGPRANWCTFATWASKQAGQTIRREDFQALVERKLAAAPEIAQAWAEVAAAARRAGARLAPPVLTAAGKASLLDGAIVDGPILARASAAISRGNTKVFAEIAAELSRFL